MDNGTQLVEIDSLEIQVIVDNELDPISPCGNPLVAASGNMRDIGLHSTSTPTDRGPRTLKELRMQDICCGAHGFSAMVTAVKGDIRHTVLFDTGPEEHVWERNANRLKADIGSIELIQLSHWHRDHSGGMLKAVKMINEASPAGKTVTVDLHPDRPDYRGFDAGVGVVSLEADPSFDEIKDAGATVSQNSQAHTVLDDMFFISGEIPRKTEYELGVFRGMRYSNATGEWDVDTAIKDERYLMCRLKDKGLVIFTGCAHAGAINTCFDAIDQTKNAPIYGLVGGYHLADADPTRLKSTVEDLKKLQPKIAIPGHCSGWRVKQAIDREMPGIIVPCGVGMKYTI